MAFNTLGVPLHVLAAALQQREADTGEAESTFAPRINGASARMRREAKVEDILLGKGRDAQQKALQQREAALSEAESTFAPHINGASARMRRDAKVEDVLLGKGRVAQQKRERAVRAQERAAAVSARSHRPSQSTDAHERRYRERTGQASAERLLERRAPSAQTPSLHGGSDFRDLPAAAAAPPPSARAVAERNLNWAQQREQRLRQLARRQRCAEREVCTFRPAVGGGAYLEAVGATSDLDVVARGAAWQASRESRLEAARRALLAQAAAELRAPRAPSPSTAASPTGGEPGWMVPTTAHRNGQRAFACMPLGATFGDSCHGELPEWAAPRAPSLHVAAE